MESQIALVAGLVMGGCEVLKMTGVPTRWIPLSGLVLGVLSIFIVPDLTILPGIIGALTAMGVYSGSKTTTNK